MIEILLFLILVVLVLAHFPDQAKSALEKIKKTVPSLVIISYIVVSLTLTFFVVWLFAELDVRKNVLEYAEYVIGAMTATFIALLVHDILIKPRQPLNKYFYYYWVPLWLSVSGYATKYYFIDAGTDPAYFYWVFALSYALLNKRFQWW